MNEKKFYIIIFIEFAIFKLLYSIYYPFIIGFIRKDLTESIPAILSSVIPVLLILIPIILFIVLLSVSLKYGKKHLDIWSWKKVVITLLVIIIPQLIPLPF